MMKTTLKRLRHIATLSLITAMVVVISFPTSAFAAITDGRGNYGDCGTQMMRAYFANICGSPYTDANGDDGFVMPRRDVDGNGTLDAAMAGIDTKIELYNYLTGSTGLGAAAGQPRIGAAFIVHTMLGRSGDQANANGGKTVSAADRTLLYQALVQNPDIMVQVGVYSNRFNSGSRLVNIGGVNYIDESFFDSSLGGGSVYNVPSLLVRSISTGQVFYVLEQLCANPMGWRMPGLPTPWSTSSSLDIVKQDPATGATIGGPYASVANAIPGERYGFRYTLHNDGPGTTTRSITVDRNRMIPPSATYGGWGNIGTVIAGQASGTYMYNNSIADNTGIIPPTWAGRSYCLQVRSTPRAMFDATSLIAGPRCVYVPYNYGLRGTTAVNNQAIAAGDTTGFTHTMTNASPSGVTTTSEPTTYSIMQFTLPPTGTYDPVNYHDYGPAPGSNICVGWIVGACASVVYTSPTMTFNPGSIPIAGAPDLTAAQTNLPPGSRVCRLVVIAKPALGVTNRWDVPRCATVGKKPYTTIMNGDGWAGGSFQAVDALCSATGTQAGGFTGDYTTYSLDGNEYGSFGEYQLFALGNVSSFGSAGRPATAAATPSVNMTYRGPTTLGQFYTSSNPALAPSVTSRCMSDALQSYSSAPKTVYGSGTFDPATAASGVYTYTGSIIINASGDIPAGRHIVLIVTGAATITTNVRYATGPYASLSAIPSFTLIAAGPAANTNTISVLQNVTRLEGIYQAYDEFNTCFALPYTGGIALSHGICQEQLVVNGSVTANKFILRRIKGSDPDPALRNIPAEIFNLRSDVYLSAYGNARDSRQIRTVSEQELPPRY